MGRDAGSREGKQRRAVSPAKFGQTWLAAVESEGRYMKAGLKPYCFSASLFTFCNHNYGGPFRSEGNYPHFRYFSVWTCWLTTLMQKQRKGFIPILETKYCKINNTCVCVASSPSFWDMFTPWCSFEKSKSTVRGNKYPSVWIENSYRIGNKHMFVVQTSSTPGAPAKHQVMYRARKPTCKVTAASMPEP